MEKYTFKKYQPRSLRIWHWLNALAILGLLGTVILRKTFLSWRSNAALIESKLQGAGTSITPELAKEIAVSIRAPMWDWHYTLGFVLAGTLIVRAMIIIFVEKKCPVTGACQSLLNLRKIPSNERMHSLHFALVKTGYALFYLATLFMVVTGLVMYFQSDLKISKDIFNSVKELHELMMWFFVVFTAGHILGVVVAENRQDSGIISDMVNGGKRGS